MKNSLLLFLLLFSFSRGFGQCTLSVSINPSSPAICSGSSVVLTAKPSAGTAPYTYVWNTGETTQAISVNKAGTYTVTVTDKTAGCAPVKKSITISSAAVPNPPTAASQRVCLNSQATLTATAPGGIYQWYDAPVGGNFLASGASYTTPPVTKNIAYYVQTTINGCASQRTQVLVRIVANPVGTGATLCAGTVAVLSATGGDTYSWYDSPALTTLLGTGPNFTTPVLNATTTFYVVAVTNGCTTSAVPVVATVTPPPGLPSAANITICSGSVANLHATSSAADVFDWFTTPTGGSSLISSPDYTTPPLIATTAYYVQTSLNGCTSARTKVIVTVKPLPSAPVIPNQTICAGSSATLNAPVVAGSTYMWYDAPVGGTLLATANSFTTPVLNGPVTYYVVQTNGGCTSTRSAVTVSVNQPPVAPSVTDLIICSGSTATLTATAPGGVYRWYNAAVGGTLLATGASYTTPALAATTTYYVQTTVAGCISPRTAVTVSVSPSPVAPTAPGVVICSGNAATLTATGAAGDTFQWYDAAAAGNFLSSSQVYVTPALVSNTNYYVQVTGSNGCTSPRTLVTVTVTPTPAPPTVSGTTVCEGSPASLTASAPGGTIVWYDAAAAGTLLFTGPTYTTPALFATTTYYVQHNNGGCTSSRTPVTVNVTTFPSPEFQYASGTFCTSGANPSPAINNPSGGTFSAAPAGLVFISTATGQINVATSTPGTYVVSFASNGTCPRVTTAKVTITTTPDATFSYTTPLCQSGANPLPTFPAGASAGVFSAPAAVVFVNNSTGEIDLSKTTPGTYSITNTIVASGACPANVATFSITIDPAVAITAGPNQTVPSGTAVTLAGTISGGTASGTWSGGTGSFSNTSALNATYTPGPGESSATLTLTSADPVGPCGPRSDNVTITFSPVPPPPTVAPGSVCTGSATTLSATAPGGIYQWYDAAAGGTLLNTGPVYTTPALLSTTTYYVQTTVNGITSSRTPVVVTVNAVPVAPVAPGVNTCSGSTATLSASGSTGTYQWFDAAVGGNLLATGASYVTPALEAPASYYVQATNNGCTSPRVQVDVTVSPVPSVTSPSAGNVCSGTALNYTITSNDPAATFTWSRAAVANISNPAVNNQASGTIAETLINTGVSAANVVYVITPIAGGCQGTPFNYTVTVNPLPTVTSSAIDSICNESPVNYPITFSAAGTSFTWSRAAVASISNAAVSGQTAGTIREVLFNTTSVPVDVTYIFSYSLSGCSGTFSYVVTVYPTAMITSAATGTICGSTPQNYLITSDVPSATFAWSRAVVAGITNPAVNNQASSTIDETLINTTTSNIRVDYIITPMAYGCTGKPFTYSVIVDPQPPTPVANSNSPVCVGSAIKLQTPVALGATYVWSGPNGFSSSLQNPIITNVTMADTGIYSLVIIVRGCPSNIATTHVMVDAPPISNAGPDQVVCTNSTSIQLAGSVTGGTTTGVWTTAGTGAFSPSANTLNAQYIPSAADVTAGSVQLTLSSTSKDDCAISVSSMKITFQEPAVTSPATGSICTGTAQNYTITSNDPAATFVWSRPLVAGISNPAIGGQTSTTITETLINTTAVPVKVVYTITPTSNGCPGKAFKYALTVNPQPGVPTATSNSPVCVNSTINLQTPTIAGATYAWTGPNGYTSAAQNPVISNVTLADAGAYSLIISVSGCPSPPATVNVTVDPPPVAVAGPDQTVCTNIANVPLAGSVTGGTTTGVWTSSGAGTFTPNQTTLNAQYVPSLADRAAGSVVLTLTSTSADNCAASVSSLTITFQAPAVSSAATGIICTGTAQNYTITSNDPAATFTWSRAAVAGISNTSISGQTSATITETLINTTGNAIDVVYIITPISNGCPGNPFDYTVTVNPTPITPTATSNSPVCVNSTINLQTPAVANATYAWTGPGGFSSNAQNPSITNVTAALAGTYSVIVTVNGCPSAAGTVDVTIDQPPLATAGPDQTVCTTTASINLSGTVTGGTTTGAWTTSGTGTFNPSASQLTTQYIPSAQDKAAGSVVLTLSSTSADNCAISTSSLTVTFEAQPAADAGADIAACTQDAAVPLNGKLLIAAQCLWTTSGTGTFTPSANQLNASYVPSAADIAAGSVTLTLSVVNAGQCFVASDAMVITFIPPPTVNAGGTVYVLQGRTITLNPVVSDNNVTYLWSPATDLSSTTIKNPVVTGTADRTYTLTVTDSRGCITTDQVLVKVSPEIVIPNTFTPNGDGVNDQWTLEGILAYQNPSVDIYDRYGQKVFHSIGYGKPWDGTQGGKAVPYGVYYYIIDTKLNGIVLTGYVTVVR